MNLNKGISTPVAIGLIVVISVVVGVLVWQFTKPAEQPTPKQASNYTSQATCEGAGYYWYEETCHEEQQSTTQGKSIKVISPNGGEQWGLDRRYDITWETVNFDSGEKVKITLLKDDVLKGVIATTTDTGSYTWNIKSDLGTKFESIGGNLKIKLCSVSNQEVCDESNESFRVVEKIGEAPSKWPSYRNDKLNYRIQYPFQAEVTKESEDEVRIKLPLSTDTRCGGKYLRIVTEESTSQECSNPLEKDLVEDKGTVKINGTEFKKEIASNIDGSRYIVYTTLKKQRCFSLIFALEYSIICPYPEERACPPVCEVAEESEVFDQMISSFEFTD